MDDVVISTHLENLDRRAGRIEQFLPTLATKEELRLAIQEGVAPLATKDELREAIAPLATKEELREAIAPLATKEELRAAIAPLPTREEMHSAVHTAVDEVRRHMTVLLEAHHSDIQLLAEHVSAIMSERRPPS